MTINQAFEILKKSGDIHAAKIIIENMPKIGWLRAHYIAHKLRTGTPVAKIIHQKWFYGLRFYTNKHTLDPRPDTETLIESVIYDKPKSPKILDLGTGTGCIIISLVKNIPSATGIGVDISWRARQVARKNVKIHNVQNQIKIKSGNFANKNLTNEKFNIVVSNPPYIAHNDPRVDVGAKHDPKIALYAKHNGLDAYEQIAKNAKHWIANDGRIYVEIGSGQEKDIRKIFKKNGWQYVRSNKDLAGIIRVLVFKI